MIRTRIALLAGALAAAAALALPGHAQAFPDKVVRIVVPFPAGGTADLLPRVIGEKVSAKWGQPVIIENKAGAGGNIGAEQVWRSDPDGHTLFASPPGPLAINHNLYKELRFDPTRWVPVTVMATVPNVLAARTGLEADSVGAVIAMARANPGKLTYASQGNGSTSHLTANLFESMAKVKMLHIPYKGTAPALNDLMGGQVDIFFDNLGSSLKQHEAGRIKILAVASPKRAGSLPNVPTVAEAALPGFQSVTWFAVVAPPGTPEAIVQEINAAMAEAIQHPEVQRRFRAVGADPVGNTRAEAAAFIREETERWQKVIEAANMPRI
jgi:tripartite-type tricarboxylate transporter receptor subunit TctC